MLTYDKALRAVGKAINALRNEARMQGNPLPPTPYVVAEVASRITLDPTGEWYDQNLAYMANIRRLVDRILKGDGVEYLRNNRRDYHQNNLVDEDPYGADTDWANTREARKAVGRLFPNLSKSQKLRRHIR